MRRLALCLFLFTTLAHGGVLSQLTGIVHDPQHRPIPNASITLTARNSALALTTTTASDGAFTIATLPLGEYTITVTAPTFATLTQQITIVSNTSPILHLQLAPAAASDSVTVTALTPIADTATPTTLISRIAIASTPGATRTNSLAAITANVPGSYITHNMLHMRGGHQLSWQIDGVQIPNTNIASNLGAQIDPKDIDYLEVQRGSYSADTGDRTFGVFNVLPRTGFGRNREAELTLSAGNFLQTNDQLNLASHTEKFAYYTSLTANRSNLGLAPPIPALHHDAANGAGAFSSFIYNRTPSDQLRLVAQSRYDFFQIPTDPDPTSTGNQQYNSSGLRDTQRETDTLTTLTWAHAFSPRTQLQLSPFFHRNAASYQPPATYTDQPIATTSNRSSTYAGLQTSLTTTIARNTMQAGLYSFAQHDTNLFGSIFNNHSNPNFSIATTGNGGIVEAFLADNYKLTQGLTLIAGLRISNFRGAFSETVLTPRIAAAYQLPHLNWTARAFYGRFYQPPPLVTTSGPIVTFANASNTTFQPLHGERDEEHQFGLQIQLSNLFVRCKKPGAPCMTRPHRGMLGKQLSQPTFWLPLSDWLLDIDTFKTRANNFLDHASIGESSLYFPVTINGALIQGWELTLHSPTLSHNAHAHLTYSNQIAKQRGAITGGLVCFPIGDPACTAAFAYTPVDHDQRNTLDLGYTTNLPARASASINFSYGSGFHNGTQSPQYPNAYLPAHSSLDLSLSRTFAKTTTLTLSAINLTNHRTLLDNSLTFGGLHYNNPRELFAELRFRFHY